MKQRVLTYMRSTLGKSFSFDLDLETKELLDEGWTIKQVSSSTGIAEPNSGRGNSRKAVTITLVIGKFSCNIFRKNNISHLSAI